MDTSTPQAAAEDAYGTGYLSYKGWDLGAFAAVSAAQRDYFSQEVAALPGLRVRRALDVGFGLGNFLGFGRERGWEMSGTEVIPELVAAARSAGFDAHPADCLADLPAGAFDLVTAFDVLEHIPEPELPGFLALLRDRLAPGGLLLCRFPNGDSPFGRPFQNGDPTHRTVIGEAKLNAMLPKAGLEIVRFAGEARSRMDRSWRMLVSLGVVRLLEMTLEPCIKRVMFPGWRFAMFSPNTVVAMRRAGGG